MDEQLQFEVVRVEIAKLELGPRDILLVTVADDDLSLEQMQRLQASLSAMVPSGKVVVSQSGLRFSTLTPPLIEVPH